MKKKVLREKVIDIMVEDIIRKYGFENENTIRFCRIAEKSNSMTLIMKLYRKLMDS